MIVFLNGSLLPEAEAHISPTDRGFTLGDGVFDTLLADNGVPLEGMRHFRRLREHAAMLRIPVNAGAEELEGTARTLLQKNGADQGLFTVRTTISRGKGARGLPPPSHPDVTVLMQVAPLPAAPATPDGLAVIIAQRVRRNEHSPLARIKSLNYGDNIAALMEANDAGAADAIMLNTAGHAACATAANIFILEKGRLVTPPLEDGAMDGIMRSIIMEHAGARVESITPERLAGAEGVYLTNSIRGIRPVTAIDGKQLASCNDYFEIIARDIRDRKVA